MSKSNRSTPREDYLNPEIDEVFRSGFETVSGLGRSVLGDEVKLSELAFVGKDEGVRRDIEVRRLRRELADLKRDNEALQVEKRRLLSRIKGQQDEAEASKKDVEIERSLRVVAERKLALKEAEVAHEKLAGERAASKERVWRGKGM